MDDFQHRGSRSTAHSIFIGKWTVTVLFTLKEKPYRHGQLRRRLGKISQRMLTRTLRNLESTGLITRNVTRARSVSVEYSLTKVGRAFLVPLSSICRWAERQQRQVNAVIHLSRRSSEEPIEERRPSPRDTDRQRIG